MGVDLRLFVPAHVYVDDLMVVVKRFMRDPDLIKKSLQSSNGCNVDLPSNKKNSWYFTDKNQKSSTVVPQIPSMIMCNYNFLGIEDRMFYMHYENHTYKKEVLGHKLISARSSPIQIAMATQLVKIFGGYLSHADSSEHYDLIIKDKDALYNSKNYMVDDPDDHFYSITNFVNKLTCVCSDHLIQANGQSAYNWSDEELHEYADKIQECVSKYEKQMIAKEIVAITPPINPLAVSNTDKKSGPRKKIKI